MAIKERELTPEEIVMKMREAGSEDEVKRLRRMLPEDYRKTVDKIAEAQVLIKRARENDNVYGFGAYYKLLKKMELPEHCKKWVEDIYSITDLDYDGKLTLAFRGSWKSTTLSVVFQSFYIGHHPEKTNVVIMASDDSANNITKEVADIIENNPFYKLIFPNVVPYKERGWGDNGYWVRDGSVDIAEWSKERAGIIDPTFIAGGVGSAKLIGKHPNGLLICDDLHDDKNSFSMLMRQRVVKIFSDTILPMAVKIIDPETKKRKMITKVLLIGTPWEEDDVYQYAINTGQFLCSYFPIIEKAEKGEKGAVYFDGHRKDGRVDNDMIGWWKINFPEMYNKEAVMAERAKSGARGFARMYLLDLKLAKTRGLKYYTYPHEQIQINEWPLYGGVDFATVIQKKAVDEPGRDKFSMAYGAKSPLNKLIIFDGIIEQCTQAQAEMHMLKPQSLYPNWQHTVIEGDGVGEQFWVHITSRNPGLRIMMKKTGGVPKAIRQERELGVWLERGMIYISDADTPYLNELRKALDDFPDGNNDIRDGAYWLGRACPDVMVEQDDSEGMPENGYFELSKKSNDRGKRFSAALGGRSI